MLEVPTVFVLGAGASVPYKFPTGFGLTSQVVNDLRPGHAAFNDLQLVGITEDEINRFRYALYRSAKNSVDAFLEHRLDLMAIGKLASAHILIAREVESELFTFENSWLRELYNRLNSSFETFSKNRLSFVTFNYDRSVEHFFFSALSHTYNKPEDQVKAVLENIPLVHLHGRLGALPWQGGEVRPYNHQIEPTTLRIAANNIKIIHEDISDGRDKDFEKAKKLLIEAEQIFFMGFGYNDTNIERLGIRNLTAGTARGTKIGLGTSAVTAAAAATDGKISLVDGDCTHFIRELVRWK